MALFGEQLKKLRNSQKETQKDMADKLNVSVRTIANWEAGDRTPTIETLTQIAMRYSVSTDYLLGLSDMPLYEHKIGNRYYYTTSKEPPVLTEGEPEVDTEKTVSLRGDALPANRQELEQFVRKLLQDMLPEKRKSE